MYTKADSEVSCQNILHNRYAGPSKLAPQLLLRGQLCYQYGTLFHKLLSPLLLYSVYMSLTRMSVGLLLLTMNVVVNRLFHFPACTHTTYTQWSTYIYQPPTIGHSEQTGVDCYTLHLSERDRKLPACVHVAVQCTKYTTHNQHCYNDGVLSRVILVCGVVVPPAQRMVYSWLKYRPSHHVLWHWIINLQSCIITISSDKS